MQTIRGLCLCVLCAGVWATKLGEMAGVKVPLIAMHHAYVVTERIEGIQVGHLHRGSTTQVAVSWPVKQRYPIKLVYRVLKHSLSAVVSLPSAKCALYCCVIY